MAKVYAAELIGHTAVRWLKLPSDKKKTLLSLYFVRDFFHAKIWFTEGFEKEKIATQFEKEIKKLSGLSDIRYLSAPTSVSDRISSFLSDKAKFSELHFGSDVAEHDENLFEYFISTDVYKKVKDRRKSIVVGPKGSGKSAILRAAKHYWSPDYVISITPEIFSKSIIAQISETMNDGRIEEEDLIVTWVYSIFTEIFKMVCANPRGISNPRMLGPIRSFLRDNTGVIQLDLFGRFVGYLRDIQNVKIGSAEVSVKTRRLKELYALESVYSLIPILRNHLKEEVVILIDELDQGWDNSEESNEFLVALLQAAIRMRALDCKTHVISFIRTEIFDIVKGGIPQLDKLRSEITQIKWFNNELRGVISRRIAHSLNIPNVESAKIETSVVDNLFDGNFQGLDLFDYIVSRTTRRPREILQFIKLAHEFAVDSGKAKIEVEDISEAEKTFSQWKVEHLSSEYLHIYPKIGNLIEYFQGFGPILSKSDIVGIFDEFVRDYGSEILDEWSKREQKDALQILFEIEFIGCESGEKQSELGGMLDGYRFSHHHRAPGLRRASSFIIHPVFWDYLELSSGLKA